MRRIPIARGAGDPEQLRTPGMPVLTQWNDPGNDPGVSTVAAAEPERAAAPVRQRKRSLGPLIGLLVVVALGVGGYQVWKNPQWIGFESWGEVQAAFSGEGAAESPGAAPADAPPAVEQAEDAGEMEPTRPSGEDGPAPE